MTILKIVCAYCQRGMGEKDGLGVESISHSICLDCWAEKYPDIPYPTSPDEGVE